MIDFTRSSTNKLKNQKGNQMFLEPRRRTLSSEIFFAVDSILILLLIMRVVVSVYSMAGMGWDFPNYYRVGTVLSQGQIEHLCDTDVFTAIIGFPISSYVFASLEAWRRVTHC